jgi:hypothetical protein
MDFKAIARRLFGEQTMGMIDYYRDPGKRAWGGAFNGQDQRRRLFEAIVASVDPKAFVETGTHIGTTTEFLARFGKPVFTVEGEPRAYGFAKLRFRRRHGVTLVRGDSRNILRQWFDGPLRQFADSTLLFYLDAHWGADLPLAEELDIIFTRCTAAVAMVDDFQVPGDPAYGYDDYGPGKCLNLDYVASTLSAHGLAGYYPATRAAEESGRRRGCVIVAREAVHGMALGSIPLLRSASDVVVQTLT